MFAAAQGSTPAPGAHTRRSVGVEFSVLLAALAALTLGVKVHKAWLAVGGHVPWRHVPVVLADDVLSVVAWGVGWGLLLVALTALGWPRGAGWAQRLFRLATVGLALLVMIEHGFFLATGSLLDTYMLLFGIQNLGDRGGVILSGVPPWLWAGVGLGLAALVVPEWLARRRPGFAATATGPQRPQPRSVAALAAGVVLLAGAAGALRLRTVPGDLAPIRAGLFVGLARSGSAAAAPVAIVAPMDPVEVVAGPTAQSWNVVFVILESTRAQSVPLGNGDARTMPFLAELAARGAHATTAYTMVPHTTKSIVPIHCGIAPKIDVANDEAVADALPVECLPSVLRRRGYATAMFTSVDEAYEAGDRFASNFGFQTYRGPESLPQAGFDRCSYFGFEDDILLDPALAWVDRQRVPFVLSLLSVVPHHEYKVPKGFPRETLVAANPALDGYLNCLRYSDRWLKKLHDGLRRRGLLERTLLVIVGDHGEGFGEHGRYQHDNVIYEEGLRVPLVVVGPGVPAGTHIEGLRQNIDIVPTLYELLGLRVASGRFDGRSLLSHPPHDSLQFSCYYQNHCMALRRGDMKAIYHYSRRPTEVFDLAQDPSEAHDLVALDRAPAGFADAAATELEAWKAQVNGRYLARATQLRATWLRPARWASLRPLDLRWPEAGVVLYGVSTSTGRAQPGEVVEVTLDLTLDGSGRTPPRGTGLFVHLLGPAGTQVNIDHVPVGGSHPLAEWRAGEHVRDRFTVRVPGGWQAGRYRLVVGLWNSDRGSGSEGRVPVVGPAALIDGARRATVHEIEGAAPE
ncbi:MAG: hypothetical protein EXR79_14090 [Myxococcales bacterium]|nr:hypothetical protein [Myxococcales bacterium]